MIKKLFLYSIYVLIISLFANNYENYLNKYLVDFYKPINNNSINLIDNQKKNCSLCWNLNKNMHTYPDYMYMGITYYDDINDTYYTNDNLEQFTCVTKYINEYMCDYIFDNSLYKYLNTKDDNDNLIKNNDLYYDFDIINCTICTNVNHNKDINYDINNLNCSQNKYSIQHCFITIQNIRRILGEISYYSK